MKRVVVMSLGGSMVVTESGINIDFLKKFKKIIRATARRNRIIIVVGGGSVCRQYQKAARLLGIKNTRMLDWIGVRATQFNAEFVRSYLADIFGVEVYGGDKPGATTDTGAVQFAIKMHASHVINISNVDYIYDRDPKKFPNAKKLILLSWAAYRAMIGKKREPGMNVPFDPVASHLAAKHHITVYFVSGSHSADISSALAGKKFSGSIISFMSA